MKYKIIFLTVLFTLFFNLSTINAIEETEINTKFLYSNRILLIDVDPDDPNNAIVKNFPDLNYIGYSSFTTSNYLQFKQNEQKSINKSGGLIYPLNYHVWSITNTIDLSLYEPIFPYSNDKNKPIKYYIPGRSKLSHRFLFSFLFKPIGLDLSQFDNITSNVGVVVPVKMYDSDYTPSEPEYFIPLENQYYYTDPSIIPEGYQNPNYSDDEIIIFEKTENPLLVVPDDQQENEIPKDPQDETNEIITNTDIDDTGSNFFDSFTTKEFGLSSVITKPLELITNINLNNCKALVLPIPFTSESLSLPCMTSIYKSNFPLLLTLYQTITTGFLSYHVLINLFHKIKKMKDPENDDIEVLDL